MAPVTEMADYGNNPVLVPEAQPELPSQAGREISRAARQKRIELNARDCKSKLSKDINTVTKMLDAYQADFPEDDTTAKYNWGKLLGYYELWKGLARDG